MAKKSKPSVKEETIESVKEEITQSGEDDGRFNYVDLFNVVGVLIGIFFIIVGILRYVFHIL